MKEEEFGPIEQEIIKEETPAKESKPAKPPPLSNLLPKLLILVKNLKKPKAISVIILMLLIFLIYMALSLLGAKQPEEKIIPNVIDKTKPSAVASADPALENISQRVEKFGRTLDSLENYQKELTRPIVDLDISF